MKFNRFRLLWQETQLGDSTGLAEPSEVRFRAWVLALAMLVGPPLLLLLYYKTMFPGLTNPDALDFAQLGRNLSSGRGFVTDILRPLALTHGSDPLRQPDVTHGPLFPFLLALAFGALGAKDTVAAMVSGVFYLLTVPVVYLLGVRVFNRAVGLLTALIFTFNALLLEYAASGTHITLYVFLMTSLLLVLYQLANAGEAQAERMKANLPKGALVLAGLLTALLYLADPIFIWIVPVVLGSVISLNRRSWPGALILFLVPLLLLTGPWMWRNATLTGNPVFGLRGLELWMNTKGYYPGLIAYRMSPGELIPGQGLFKAIVQKILFGAGQVIQAFPQVTASWVLAFLLPSLLFQFSGRAANSLRRIMMWCFLGLFVGMLLFEIQMPLFVSLIPTMLVFSVAYLLHLLQQAHLSRGSVGAATVLLAIAVVYPLVTDMTLTDKIPTLKEASSARAFGKMATKTEVCFSDQPWIVAWYADRPAVWIPADDSKIAGLRQQFAQARWLFLTGQVENYSPDWQYLHGFLQQRNMAVMQAQADKKAVPPLVRIGGSGQPLFKALDGFFSVNPIKDSAPSTVIAAVPLSGQQAGQAPKSAGSRADATSASPHQ